MTYLIVYNGLIAAGILVLILRYRKTAGFRIGMGAFLLQCVPLLHLCAILYGSYHPGPVMSFLPIAAQIVSGFSFLDFAGRIGAPKQPRAAAIWFNGGVLLFAGFFLAVFVLGFVRFGSDILVMSGKIAFWTVLVLGVISLIGNLMDKSAPGMSVALFLGGLLGMALIVFVLIHSGAVFYRAHPDLSRLAYEGLRLIAAAVFLLASVAIVNCMGGPWVSFAGAAGLSLIAVCAFLVPPLIQIADFPLPSAVFASLPLLILLGWTLLVFFLFLFPISSFEPGAQFGVRPPGLFRLHWSWAGLACLLVGAAVCAWQMYEVKTGEHFTFWVIRGIIPVPVIALGMLLILGGIACFLFDVD